MQIANDAVSLPYGAVYVSQTAASFSYTADDDMKALVIITAFDISGHNVTNGIIFRLRTDTTPTSIVWCQAIEKGYGTSPHITTTAIAIKVLSAGTYNLIIECKDAVTFGNVFPAEMTVTIMGMKK